MMNRLLILCCIILLFASCRPAGPDAETPAEYTKSGDTLRVAPGSALSGRLKTGLVKPGSYTRETLSSAQVRAIPTRFAQIAPLFSGRVTRSYVKLGQRVAKDAALFSINSADFMETQKEFFQMKASYELARQTLARQQDLLENGVGTAKNLEEAENALELAKQEYHNIQQAIRIYGVDPQHMQLGQELIVRSPLSGEVLQDNLVVGQFLKEDTQPVLTIADLSTVWIVGQVKEKDIRHLNLGDRVEIKVAAYPDLLLNGTIHHIDNQINEQTRSVEVLIESENPESRLKNGMYVTAKYQNQPAEEIIVPLTAVLQEEEASFVYLQSEEDTYIKRNVITGETLEDGIVVLSGLSEGERLIYQGGYYLLNIH